MSNEEQETEEEEAKEEEEGAAEEAAPQTLLEKTTKVVERLEKANAELAKQNKKLEELQAFQKLGGQSVAGIRPPQEKEETPEEYANRILTEGLNPLRDDENNTK